MAFSAIPLFYYKEFYMNVQPKLENYYLCLKANLKFYIDKALHGDSVITSIQQAKEGKVVIKSMEELEQLANE